MSVEVAMINAMVETLIGVGSKNLFNFFKDEIRGRLALTEKGDSKEAVLQPPSTRMAIGQQLRNGKLKATVIVEESSGPAFQEAKQMEKESNKEISVLIVGRAFSSHPENERGKVAPGASLQEWRPGRSVSHIDGFAGTIGAFVTFKKKKLREKFKGFTSASHVLGLLGQAELDDKILCPGPPDGPRDLENTSGYLRKCIALCHYKGQATPRKIFNKTDIAIAEMKEDVDFPSANLVPDPKSPETRFIQLQKVLSLKEMLNLSDGGEVYTFGRSSGFAKGKLISVNVQAFPIRLADRRSYLYGDLGIIEAINRKRGFSLPGDSGAPIYTAKGELLGFVVGGAGYNTFFHAAEACFQEVDATLI